MIDSDKMLKIFCHAQLAANPSYVYNSVNLIDRKEYKFRKNKGRSKTDKPQWP